MIQPGTVVGNYRIERVIGRGGMGVVYEATQLSLDRRLALKLLRSELSEDPAFAGRFRREGRMQAALEHPAIVTVHEAGSSEHGLFLAMQLVRGTSLAALLREGSLPAARALRLLRQVGEALDAAHVAGLVHRDVKPRNVLVDASDRAYLADFGLTRVGGESSVTASGELVGTVAYLAPEVIAGEQATAASDRYAFAAMLFECLAGDVPYPRSSEAAILYAHTSEPPPRISERRAELPAELDAVFRRALAKGPSERPASALAIVERAEHALDPETIVGLGPPPSAQHAEDGETTPSAVPRPRESLFRHYRIGHGARIALVAAIAGAVLSGLVTGLVVNAASGDGTDDPVPSLPEGAVALGSDLSGPAVSVDCRGREPTAGSRPCSILQTALPDAVLVVPSNGAIVGWTVKGARGEIALQILRRREGKTFQIQKSQYEVVPDERTHYFAANLEVERGDVVGIELGGGGIGVREGVDASATERWFPPVRGAETEPTLRAGTGFDHEVFLRVDYVPGGKRTLPEQLLGVAAAAQPTGRVRARRPLPLVDGRRLEIRLVEVGDRVALDLWSRGERVSRVFVPDLRPRGEIIYFYATPYDDPSGEVGIQWVNPNSGRFLEHYFVAQPREFVFVG